MSFITTLYMLHKCQYSHTSSSPCKSQNNLTLDKYSISAAYHLYVSPIAQCIVHFPREQQEVGSNVTKSLSSTFLPLFLTYALLNILFQSIFGVTAFMHPFCQSLHLYYRCCCIWISVKRPLMHSGQVIANPYYGYEFLLYWCG